MLGLCVSSGTFEASEAVEKVCEMTGSQHEERWTNEGAHAYRAGANVRACEATSY